LQAALLISPLLLFPRLLDPGSAFFYRDILVYWLPQVDVFARTIAEGSLPLWDPYSGFGAPMIADASNQFFYPFKWLNLVLWPATYYKLLVATHTAFAALGMFRLARRYGLCDWPAFVAAGMWVASGPFLSTVAHHHFVSASWMAWVLLAAEAVLDSPTAAAASRLALAAAAMLFGGSADVTLMTAMLACLRGATRLAQPSPAGQRLRVARAAALAALLALGVSAAQWVPTLAQMSGSGRAAMDAQARGYWSLSPLLALDMFFPRLVADAPLSPAARARHLDSREPFLTCLYLGAAALPLVVLGACSPAPARAFLLLGLLVFGVLALGRWNPAFGVVAWLPPFSLLRYPVKYVVPLTLCCCLLAGRGVQAWLAPDARRPVLLAALLSAGALALVAGAACGLLGSGGAALLQAAGSPIADTPEARAAFTSAALASCASTLLVSSLTGLLLLARRSGGPALRSTAVLAGLLAVADAARVGRTIDPPGPAQLLRHVPPAVEPLRRAADASRFLSLPAPREVMISQLARGPRGWEAEPRWALGLLELLQPPSGARFGLFGSYDGDFTGLAPGYAGALRALLFRTLDGPVGLRLLQLANVGHVVALGDPGLPQLEQVASPLQSVFRDPIRVFGVKDPLPRFYAVGTSRVVAEPASYGALADPGFDPEREVLLAPPATEARGGEPFAGRLRLLERSANRLSLDAELSRDGFAVLVEAWDPGWRAWVDGQPAPVMRANVLFRAVAVPAGRHRLELLYRPPAVAWGAAIAAAALAVAGALALRRG
jgi:hypothetical protein